MRIWGHVLVVIGFLFLILFLLAALGGGHIGVLPFLIAVFVIGIGGKFIRSGKGIVQATPAATAQIAGGVPSGSAAVAGQSPTVEMAMSPEVAAIIARHIARSWRIVLYLAGGFVVFFGGLSGVLAILSKGGGDGFLLAGLLGGIGVATALLIIVISWLTTRRPVNRDLRRAIYLRTTGPIQVVPISGGGMLRLADRAFLMNGRAGLSELSKLNEGRVDYSPHGHVILAAWDSQGRRVYCAPGYNVD